MKTFLLCISLLFGSFACHAQENNICYAAYSDFNYLMNTFLQQPTESARNEEIYNLLEELENLIVQSHVSREDRYKLNSLEADIKVVKEFISPIANKYNAHLSRNNIARLQSIFGENFSQTKLKVKCPMDEVEFIEVQVGELMICYFHCISKKADKGLRIKYYASSGNSSCNGEYGAMKDEYTPIIHNVGQKYLKVRSAKITNRF